MFFRKAFKVIADITAKKPQLAIALISLAVIGVVTITIVAVKQRLNTNLQHAQISGHSTKDIPSKTPQPVLPSVTIASDGCMVTAHGQAGLIFVTGSYLSGHHGGVNNYILLSSNTMTESSGGVKNDTAFGEIIGSGGKVLVTVTTPITANACPAGDPSATDNSYPLPPGALKGK